MHNNSTEEDKIYQFYQSQIQDNFYPYWSQFIDDEFGGVLNCINNQGDILLSDNKFSWSQGRFLWILAHIYELSKKEVFPKIDKKQLMNRMEKLYDFLTLKCMDEQYVCYYLLTKEGEKIQDKKTGRYDASIFSDCFVLIGMASYVRVTMNKDLILTVEKLFASIVRRIELGVFATEPYPIPKGYKIHSIPMIMVNTTYEFIRMKEAFGLDTKNDIAYGLSKVSSILNEFYRDGLIREHVSTEENDTHLLLDRHVNPGHTLEDMWFLIEFLQAYGNVNEYLPKILAISKRTFELGWDPIYGGLLRFVDKEGGKPKGICQGSDFEKLILETWNMKLWWPHSEILYLFVYLHKITGNEEWMDYYKKSADYVFSTFPNHKQGEWIQIRKQDGTPEEKLVALPVKDPFHIMRNFVKILYLYTI